MLHVAVPDPENSDLLRVPCAYAPAAGTWFGQARKYTTMPSLQGMSKIVRGALAKAHGWREFDIVNCFPTLLLILMEKAGIACEPLRLYVTNRDALLHQWSEALGVDRATIKRVVLCILFFGNYSKILAKSGRPLEEASHPDLDHFKKELTRATKQLAATAENKTLLDRAKACAEARKADIEAQVTAAKDRHTLAVREEEARLQAHAATVKEVGHSKATFQKELHALRASLQPGAEWTPDGFDNTKSTNALAIFASFLCQHHEARFVAATIRRLHEANLTGVGQIFDAILVSGAESLADDDISRQLAELNQAVVRETGLESTSATLRFELEPFVDANVGREFEPDQYDDLIGVNEAHVQRFLSRFCLEGKDSPHGLSLERGFLPFNDWYLKSFCNTGKSFLLTELIPFFQRQRQRTGRAFSTIFTTSRKALTAQIVKQFADAKLVVRPYNALTGALDIGKFPLSVWQVDSMPRAVKGAREKDLPVLTILVLDEVLTFGPCVRPCG